jgi:DNA mismatch repair protein MutS2
MRIIEIENSKRKKSYHQGVKGNYWEEKEVIQEVTVQVEEIRKEREKLKLLLKNPSQF